MEKGSLVEFNSTESIWVAAYVKKHSRDIPNFKPSQKAIELIHDIVGKMTWKVLEVKNRVILCTKEFIKQIVKIKKLHDFETKIFLLKVQRFFCDNEFIVRKEYLRLAV